MPRLDLSFDGSIAGLAAPGSDIRFVVEGGDCKWRHTQRAAWLVATVATSPGGPFAPTTLRDHGRHIAWRAPLEPGRYFLRIAAGPPRPPGTPAQVAIDVVPPDAWLPVTLRLPTGGVPPNQRWLRLERADAPSGWTPPYVALPWARQETTRAVSLPAGRWRAFDAVHFEHQDDDRPPTRQWRTLPSLGRPARAVVTVTQAGVMLDLAQTADAHATPIDDAGHQR